MCNKVLVIIQVAFLINLCFFLTECGRVKRVVGGMEVECGTQPRVASLRNSSSSQHLCGATILSPDFAVTAAHCVAFDPDQYHLQLNNRCTDGVPLRAQVVGVVPHELYDKQSRAHDIAILKIWMDLDELWLNDTVLPTSSFGVSGECTIYGYGFQDPDVMESSEKLLAANLNIVSLDECLDKLGPIAPEHNSGMMCALGNGVDSCQGDSGSPLLCNGLIEAVSSHGMSCGVPGVPGVYTSIGPHIRWIRQLMANRRS